MRYLAAIFCIALAACSQAARTNESSQGPAPQAPGPMGSEPAQTDTSDRGCTMRGFWFFHGGCAVAAVAPNGASVVLPPYRHLTVTFDYGTNDAPSQQPFIFADATGDGDVTGALNGTLAFPTFGSVPCVSPDGAAAACAGKPLLYLLVVNNGERAVTFDATPRITIGGTGSLDGLKACNLNTLIWANPAKLQPAWAVRNYQARISDLKLEFTPLGVRPTYGSRGAFTIFAVVCK